MAIAQFSDFIRENGVDTISGVLALEKNTIYWFAHKNRIPRKHWPALLMAFPRLKMADLLRMEAASKQAA